MTKGGIVDLESRLSLMSIFWDTKWWCEAKEKQISEATGAKSQGVKPLEEELSEEQKSNEKPQKREPNSEDRKEENNGWTLQWRSINRVIGEIVSTIYNIDIFYYMPLLKTRQLRYIIWTRIVYGNNSIGIYRIRCITNFKALPPLKTLDCDIQHGPNNSITIQLNEASRLLCWNCHIASLKGCHVLIYRLWYNVAKPLHRYNMLYCHIASAVSEPLHRKLCTPSLKKWLTKTAIAI